MPDPLTPEEQRDSLIQAERKGRKTIAKKAKQLEVLEITYIPVTGIRPNPWNPNRQSDHDFELLCRSMEDDGFTQPVLAITIHDEHLEDQAFAGYEAGEIVITDGEHRWRAAQKLGFTEIPVVLTDMTTEQMRISTLRHNRAKGSEDIELSTEMLRDLERLGAKEQALDGLMMTAMEMERLMEDTPVHEALASEEYGEAWEPDKAGSDVAPVEGRESVHDSGTWTNASTGRALDAVRDREKALSEAKSVEQREMIQRDMSKAFHRVSLLLYGDDAEAAKKVLKGAPAEILAKLCRDALEQEPEFADGTWVPIDDVLGRRTIPAEMATVIARAIDRARSVGDVSDHNKFQILEYLAADYLAGKDES